MLGGVPRALEAMAAALDLVPDHVVVLSKEGRILHANEAWQRFARENGGDRDWTGVDYLAGGDPSGPDCDAPDPMSLGLRDVLDGQRSRFEYEYACHAPDELRWFRLTATRVDVSGIGAVIAHTNISPTRSTDYVLGWRATHDPITGALNADTITTHARRMIAEGCGVTVVRVLLEDERTAALDAEVARAAAALAVLFPAPAAIGRTDHGLAVVQGGESDADLLEALRATYEVLSGDFAHLRVAITGERLSQSGQVSRRALDPGHPKLLRPAPPATAAG